MSNQIRQDYAHSYKVWYGELQQAPLNTGPEPRIPSGLTSDEARVIREGILHPRVVGPSEMTLFSTLIRRLPWISWLRLDDPGSTAVDLLGPNPGEYLNSPERDVPAEIYAEEATGIEVLAPSKQGVKVPDSTSLHVGDKFTIILDFQLENSELEANRTLVCKGPGGFQIRVGEEGKIELNKQNVTNLAYGNLELSVATKYFLVITRDGADTHVYLQGEDVSLLTPTVGEPIEDTTEPLLIGLKAVGSSTEAGNFALVDNFLIGTDILTPEQVKQLWEARRGPPSPLLFRGSSLATYIAESGPTSIQAAEEDKPPVYRSNVEKRVEEVMDPLGGGETVYKFLVYNEDIEPLTPTENPRAQLVSPPLLTVGGTYWMHFCFLIPSDLTVFPALTAWMSLAAFYGPSFSGSGPWTMAAYGAEAGEGQEYEQFRYQRNGTYNYDVAWVAPIIRGSWVDVKLHWKLATAGFLEMWVNNVQIVFFEHTWYNPNKEPLQTKLPMNTYDSSNGEGANSMRIMDYRKVGQFEKGTLYHKKPSIGLTEAAVAGF